MAEQTLSNYRILVVEDEYLLAQHLQIELTRVGAVVLGPVGTLAGAVECIRSEQSIDGAVLDANVRGEMIFEAADLLIDRGVPFIFVTGYDPSVFPARFHEVEKCLKPLKINSIVQAVERVVLSKVRKGGKL